MIVKNALAILAILSLTACATFKTDIKEPPLPDDINIIPPSSDLPKEIAAFSGKWVGTWTSGIESILVVEEIDKESARVILSWGDSKMDELSAAYIRQACRVISDPKPKVVTNAPPLFRRRGYSSGSISLQNATVWEGYITFELKDVNTLIGDYSIMAPSINPQPSRFIITMKRGK